MKALAGTKSFLATEMMASCEAFSLRIQRRVKRLPAWAMP
jgi:hypothetical protein